jgi:hypothetical protein
MTRTKTKTKAREFYRTIKTPTGPFTIVEEDPCFKCSELSKSNQRLQRELFELRARNLQLEAELHDALQTPIKTRITRLFRGAS